MGQRSRAILSLTEKYLPSAPCACEICVRFCLRPGWWTVGEAGKAIDAGHSRRIMLEMAPDRSFGVLAPAFRGNEVDFARNLHSPNGCTFLRNNLCELHGTGNQPLECRVCHHDRHGIGKECHDDIERDWNTPAGRALVVFWAKLTGFWSRMGMMMTGGGGRIDYIPHRRFL